VASHGQGIKSRSLRTLQILELKHLFLNTINPTAKLNCYLFKSA